MHLSTHIRNYNDVFNWMFQKFQMNLVVLYRIPRKREFEDPMSMKIHLSNLQIKALSSETGLSLNCWRYKRYNLISNGTKIRIRLYI